MKCKTDKRESHKDGSGDHHPMGVFPIEQQVEHLAIAPSRYFPFAFSPPKRGIKSVCDASLSFSMEASVCLPCDVPQKWFGLGPRQWCRQWSPSGQAFRVF